MTANRNRKTIIMKNIVITNTKTPTGSFQPAFHWSELHSLPPAENRNSFLWEEFSYDGFLANSLSDDVISIASTLCCLILGLSKCRINIFEQLIKRTISNTSTKKLVTTLWDFFRLFGFCNIIVPMNQRINRSLLKWMDESILKSIGYCFFLVLFLNLDFIVWCTVPFFNFIFASTRVLVHTRGNLILVLPLVPAGYCTHQH